MPIFDVQLEKITREAGKVQVEADGLEHAREKAENLDPRDGKIMWTGMCNVQTVALYSEFIQPGEGRCVMCGGFKDNSAHDQTRATYDHKFVN